MAGYYPINNEIECFEALREFHRMGNLISLPIIRERNQMDFFPWSFSEPLSVNKIGVPEPNKSRKIEPDILLVPLVGFDKYKYRIGYGGGYYDRYIEKLSKIKKILTIGLAFSFQKVNKISVNKYDKKLDYILTEKYFIE
jgi:5,10-methenyltetrahydrofolate synthetase